MDKPSYYSDGGKTKICIFTETYYPEVGGGETQASSLAEGLIKNGFSVTIITRRSQPDLPKVEKQGQLQIYRLPPVGKGRYKRWGFFLSSLVALVRLRKNYDLTIVSGYKVIGMASILSGKLLRKPCILKADSPGEMSGRYFRSGLKKFHADETTLIVSFVLSLRNFILRKANAFVAISTEISEELKAAGVKADRILLIPNSVDNQKFSPVEKENKSFLRKRLGLGEGSILAIYTGRLVSYKGLPLLLRVWKAILQKHPSVMLLLIGPGSLDMHNCERELKYFVEAHKMQDRVIFTGPVRDVHQYLQASDLFIFPTEREAFGISLIEALGCGLPVISTPVGAIKDILQHQKNGWLVEPGNEQQLQAAIETLISDPALRDSMGREGYRTVQEKYQTDTVNEQYIQLFNNILRQNQNSDPVVSLQTEN